MLRVRFHERLLRYHVRVALPLSCHWALAHHWALFSYLWYVFVCAVFHTCLCCVPARGVAWATHSLPGVPGTGVLWV